MDDEDTEDEEQPKQQKQTVSIQSPTSTKSANCSGSHSIGFSQSSYFCVCCQGGRRRETVEYVDEDDTEDEEDADDDTDDDEEYEEVTRQPTNAKVSQFMENRFLIRTLDSLTQTEFLRRLVMCLVDSQHQR